MKSLPNPLFLISVMNSVSSHGPKVGTINSLSSSRSNVEMINSVSSSHSTVETINSGSSSRSTLEMIGSESSFGSNVEFQMVKFDTKIDKNWRVASIKDVQAHMDEIKDVLASQEWAICALTDGCVKGPGYNYEIERKAGQKLGHKIIIRGKQHSSYQYF